jgi:tetratricopeptide (TPR) repeat protein
LLKGDNDTALRFLQDSLKIRQEIGDISGECVTLFNIGHIYKQNENLEQAIGVWRKSYQMAKKIGRAQAR